ncbi:MAG: MarR family transcriptional regulator, partial [Erysipelotrichaceae bacterium]|nr:MarR family transcriptional regulator [Erysipelotrichaceae bacterium]
TQQTLQKKMNVSHPTMVGIIQRLEKNGFVNVAIDENDRRHRIVTLTGRQELLKADLRNKKEELDRKMFSDIGEEEADQLIQLLTRISENIKE